MARRADITLEIASDARLLRTVRHMLRAYLEDSGFGEEQVAEVVLAVDEACSNAIRHAYGGKPDGIVRLVLWREAEMLRVELRDEGRPAPAEKLAPLPAVDGVPSVETLRPGGLGVQLMYRVFDKVDFEPGAERGNRVLMELRRPARQD